jgi:adenylate cyclase
MATEIERKFLVTGELPDGQDTDIVQAYLSLDPERTVRVRIESGSATLTIKGRTEGISRLECEYPIPLADARELLGLALGEPVEKTRRRSRVGIHTWEIDRFHGANDGLVVAEIELETESDTFERPSWLGEEVSSEARYLNAKLAQAPYGSW